MALGHGAVEHDHQVRYFSAPVLVETPYRRFADDSVRKGTGQVLRVDLILMKLYLPRWATQGLSCFFDSSPSTSTEALACASHWPFGEWGRFLPELKTAVSMIGRLAH